MEAEASRGGLTSQDSTRPHSCDSALLISEGKWTTNAEEPWGSIEVKGSPVDRKDQWPRVKGSRGGTGVNGN